MKCGEQGGVVITAVSKGRAAMAPAANSSGTVLSSDAPLELGVNGWVVSQAWLARGWLPPQDPAPKHHACERSILHSLNKHLLIYFQIVSLF